MALVLLLLTFHAFLLATTHFHRSARVKLATDSGLIASGNNFSEEAQNASRHAQCLLCNLQRNFITALNNSLPTVAAPLLQPVGRGTYSQLLRVHSSHLVPAGRAPPFA